MSLRAFLRDALNPIVTFPGDLVEWTVAVLPRHPGAYAAIKRRLLNLAGARVGHNVRIYPGVRIYIPKGLAIGNNVSISAYVVITTGGTVTIGNNVLIGYGSQVLSANHTIPDNRGIIFGAGHRCEPVVIEDGVWIGGNAVILPGVTLGKGCVVAAGAVVTKDVEPYAIVAGIPATVMRYRE